MKTGEGCDSPCFRDFLLDWKSSLHQQTSSKPSSPKPLAPTGLEVRHPSFPWAGLDSLQLVALALRADHLAGQVWEQGPQSLLWWPCSPSRLLSWGLSSPITLVLAELPAGGGVAQCAGGWTQMPALLPGTGEEPSRDGRLCLVVLGAKNLPVRSDGTLNSFVKG